MDSMTLVWFLVRDALPQTFTFLLALFDLAEGVATVGCLVSLGGVLLHDPIWCVWVTAGIFLR
jgi:hypothetical protein